VGWGGLGWCGLVGDPWFAAGGHH